MQQPEDLTAPNPPLPEQFRSLAEDLQGSLGAVSAGPRIERRKPWDELTPDERIERLRDALRSKEMAIQDLQNQLGRLMSHTHGRNGELLGPLYGFEGMAACRRYDPLA